MLGLDRCDRCGRLKLWPHRCKAAAETPRLTSSPYREPAPPLEVRWYVLTEPSMFRTDLSRLRGPFDEKTAKRFAHRWIALHPCGEARIGRTRHWPPKLNREPYVRGDEHTTDVYREM